MSNEISTEIDGPLYRAYIKWKDNPDYYNQEKLLSQVKKIVSSEIGRFRFKVLHYDFKTETFEDFHRDLVVLAFTRLNNVKEPTNKRLYNYLRYSISLNLLSRLNNLKKAKSKEKAVFTEIYDTMKDYTKGLPINSNFITDQNKPHLNEFLPDLEDSKTNMIAKMLADGYTKTEISKEFSMTLQKLELEINKIRSFYPKLNSEWVNKPRRKYEKVNTK